MAAWKDTPREPDPRPQKHEEDGLSFVILVRGAGIKPGPHHAHPMNTQTRWAI